MSDEEIRQRVCRCCNRQFDYPVPKNRATRFHCSDCAQLKPELRKVFELMNRRLKSQQAAIDKLTKQVS